MLDYVLTAAVGISAGVGALVSAVPQLQPHTLALCLGILVIVTIVNLRGVRETGVVFMIPTYAFLGSLLVAILIGVTKTVFAAGHPVPVVAPAAGAATPATVAVSMWLLLQVFSNGCTAMTGVEAVSNGVKAFREPGQKNAQRTLTIIIFLLAVLLAGISYLVKIYGIAATDPGQPGYQSVLAMLLLAVFGKGVFYYVTIASILLVLSLSANTAFADFPRLCRAIAQNNYLPHVFAYRGRRLVYTYGITVLAVATAFLLIVFGGVTDRLIPLYAVGAFLAFTLSQAGMVRHWAKKRGAHWLRNVFINGLGATVTGITVLVVLVAKFTSGAWITVIFIPFLIFFFRVVRRHYHAVTLATWTTSAVEPANQKSPPITVVPIDRWSSVTKQALEFASRISSEIIAVHVESSDSGELLRDLWPRYIEAPFREAGQPPPALTLLPSPYRFVIVPVVQYVLKLSKENPQRRIVVVIPQLVESEWFEYFLHNQRGRLLEWALLAQGNQRIFTLSSPCYLSDQT